MVRPPVPENQHPIDRVSPSRKRNGAETDLTLGSDDTTTLITLLATEIGGQRPPPGRVWGLGLEDGSSRWKIRQEGGDRTA